MGIVLAPPWLYRNSGHNWWSCQPITMTLRSCLHLEGCGSYGFSNLALKRTTWKNIQILVETVNILANSSVTQLVTKTYTISQQTAVLNFTSKQTIVHATVLAPIEEGQGCSILQGVHEFSNALGRWMVQELLIVRPLDSLQANERCMVCFYHRNGNRNCHWFQNAGESIAGGQCLFTLGWMWRVGWVVFSTAVLWNLGCSSQLMDKRRSLFLWPCAGCNLLHVFPVPSKALYSEVRC